MPQLTDVPEFAHSDQLHPGDYIDCLSKAGKWEMVPIEQFSDFRTEFQVVWTDGELCFVLQLQRKLSLYLLTHVSVLTWDSFELVSTEHKEWLSFDRDRHRMATFGTKSISTDVPETTTNSANTGNNGPTSSNQEQGGDRAVLDVTDEAWKSEIEVGSLLDARDAAQVWYQVRFIAVFLCAL